MAKKALIGSTFAFVAALASLPACTSDSGSGTRDIFIEDQTDQPDGNERRHAAAHEERLWAINMRGCTGHLIAPDFMMSANHCSPSVGARYTSGSAEATANDADITVREIVEQDRDLDYVILKIDWANGLPKDQRYPPTVPTSAGDVSVALGPDAGDEVFTVGYPGDMIDRWGATYSEGRLKTVEETRLVYNIGTINGNSGGGVWRKADFMLVSLTNSGPHVLGTDGWNTSRSDSEANWNNGPAMWDIYAASATLRDVFPGGRNRFGGNIGGLSSGNSLYVAIGDAVATDTYTLHASAPLGAAAMVFCQAPNAADCVAGAPGYTTTSLGTPIGDRAHFIALSPTLLTNNAIWSFVALDTGGKIVASRTEQFSTP